MKHTTILIFFIIISLSLTFSQDKIDGSNLKEINGKYYSNNNLFTGKAYYFYPNEQPKEIVEFKNGDKKGSITTYYQDKNYKKSNYLDTNKVGDIELKKYNQKNLLDGIIKDTLNTFLKRKNYFNDEIGGDEKWMKLKEKWDKNELKGRKYELVQEYINLGSYHSAAVRYYLKEKSTLDQHEKELQNEKSKPVYSNKVYEDYSINSDKKDGYYTSFYQNGNKKTEGLFKNGAKDELWVEYYENGSMEKKHFYTKDKKTGEYTYYHSNGVIEEKGTYLEDNSNGLVEIYNANGLKTEEYNFIGGLRNGKWILYYDNRKIKDEGFYKNDHMDSVFRHYNMDGKLSSELNLKNDLRNGLCKYFFDSGNLQMEVNFVLGRKNGLCKTYNDNGKIIEESVYKENKLNGLSKYYYDNGKLKEEGFYLDDKKYGDFKYYDEKGLLINELQYVNNEVVQSNVTKSNTENTSQNTTVFSNNKNNLKASEEAKTNKSSNQNKVYKSVVIGTQIWMTENLNVSTFRNGDPILEAKTTEEWENAGKNKQPAWCFYENDPKYGTKYGKLYNWYAVNDQRGLAPVGWHVPSDAEWTLLVDFLGNEAGKKMKSASGWSGYGCKRCDGGSSQFKANCTSCKGTQNNSTEPFSGNGTNSSGFSGLPGSGITSQGKYGGVGSYGFWWSSSEADAIIAWDREHGVDHAYYRYLESGTDSMDSRFSSGKANGKSDRCLRD